MMTGQIGAGCGEGNAASWVSLRIDTSFSFPLYEGWQRFVYSTFLRRDRSMVKGMEKTLGRIKVSLE